MSSMPSPTAHPAEVYIGLAGWSYPDWRGVVYPASRTRSFHELAYLAQFFDAVEINTSFYRPLPAAMAERWIEQVSHFPRFRFTVKLWQRFTHEAQGSRQDERAFREGLLPLVRAGRLGALLMQFPFSFHYTAENRQRLADLLDRFAEFPCVVEVRHASWNRPGVFSWLAARDAGFCNIDQPQLGRSLQPTARTTGPVGYVRLHGRRADLWFSDDPAQPPAERYNYLYSLAELHPWLARVRRIAGQARAVFVIANNHYRGKAAVNALQLKHLLTGQPVAAPESLLQHYPELRPIAQTTLQQPDLFAHR